MLTQESLDKTVDELLSELSSAKDNIDKINSVLNKYRKVLDIYKDHYFYVGFWEEFSKIEKDMKIVKANKTSKRKREEALSDVKHGLKTDITALKNESHFDNSIENN